MCGIFGYIGKGDAKTILLDGLKALEYRGYDSAGVFLSGVGIVKAVGPVKNLEAKLVSVEAATSGIAHTRWATHGIPSQVNAHPHFDKKEQIWLVHNGIIENYRELKTGLIANGEVFYSDTDTEVLAKLIGSSYDGDLYKALVSALKLVRGAYGIALMDKKGDKIITARMGSPLVIGLSSDGNYVSSDPSALLKYTKQVVYLEDGELAVIGRDYYEVTSSSGRRQDKQSQTIEWDYHAVQKNGFPHFMLKEIFEAPKVVEDTLRGRINQKTGDIKLGGLENILPRLKTLERLQIIGCGSAYYAGLVGRLMLREYADLPVAVDIASEYRYEKFLTEKNSALLAVSQSGETADTLASLRLAKEKGLLTLGMVNVVGASIARETEAGVYNHAGPEIAVASTKAFISQLTAFVLITLLLRQERGIADKEDDLIIKALSELPKRLEEVLAEASKIEKVAKKYTEYEDFMLIGRKLHAPMAYEGALKIKEVTYIHAEGYAGGELKHGPMALLHEGLPVIALALQDDVYEKMYSNIEEIRARRAPILAVVNKGDEKIKAIVDDVIEIPQVHPIVQPIVTAIALQLFSYYLGVFRGLDIDKPRNLAKSVTVE